MLGSSCNPCCVGACKPLRIENFLIGPSGQTDALQIFKNPSSCDSTAVDSRGEYICQQRSEVFGDYAGREAFSGDKLCQYTRTMRGVTTVLLSTFPSPLVPQYEEECVPNTVRYTRRREETITTVEIYEDHVTIATHGERITYDPYIIPLGQSGTCQIGGPTFFWCPEVEPGFVEWAAIKPANCPAFQVCMRTIPDELFTCSRSWTIPISDFTQDNFGTANASRMYLRDLPGQFYSSGFSYQTQNILCSPNIPVVPVPVVGPNNTIIPWVSLSAGSSCLTDYWARAGALFYGTPDGDLSYYDELGAEATAEKVPSVVIT